MASARRASALALESRAPRLAPKDILLTSCVRNELLRIPWFLEYHRNLGVDRFLIVDNGSRDGTLEYLRSEKDVLLFVTEDSYAASNCGVEWINEVLDAYAQGHWALILDADELLIYPRCETLDLHVLVTYLESVSAQGMQAPLLDMYSEKPIRDTAYRSGDDFLKACPFFDLESYEYSDPGLNNLGLRIRGGPRHRLFWDGRKRTHPSPFLPKVPLVSWQEGLALEISTHTMRGVTLAEVTGTLLHFKFLQDFPEKVRLEADRKEHFAGARQYAAYAEVMTEDPELTAYYDGSVRYKDSLQLVQLGLMRMPPGFPETPSGKLLSRKNQL